MNLTEYLSANSAYNVAPHPSEFGWFRKVTRALLMRKKETRLDNYFTEEVVTNRGYRMKVLTTSNPQNGCLKIRRK